jgi:uncharacterized protein YdhG (YjbR/CyaY superfamily)
VRRRLHIKSGTEKIEMAEQTLSYNRYIAALPPERRDAVKRVWQVVRDNVPAGYTEQITPKYLTFMADNEWFIALANQKNYISLYLCSIYIFPELKAKLDNSGKKLKGGKGCINFKQAEDLPLSTIAEIVSTYDAESYKKHMQQIRESARAERKSGKAKAKGQVRA